MFRLFSTTNEPTRFEQAKEFEAFNQHYQRLINYNNTLAWQTDGAAQFEFGGQVSPCMI